MFSKQVIPGVETLLKRYFPHSSQGYLIPSWFIIFQIINRNGYIYPQRLTVKTTSTSYISHTITPTFHPLFLATCQHSACIIRFSTYFLSNTIQTGIPLASSQQYPVKQHQRTMTHASDYNARIELNCGKSSGNFYLDTISLKEQTASGPKLMATTVTLDFGKVVSGNSYPLDTGWWYTWRACNLLYLPGYYFWPFCYRHIYSCTGSNDYRIRSRGRRYMPHSVALNYCNDAQNISTCNFY